MLARLIKSINPRQGLTARIGWVFGTLSVVLSLLAGLFFGNLSQIAIEQQIGELYANRAAHIADAVDLKIQSGTSAMHLAVSLLGIIEQIDDPDANRKLIGTIKQNIDGTVWVGITDPSGRVLAGDGQRLEGVNLAGQSWFNAAIKGRYVAGPEQFRELENGLGSRADGRFRDFLIITTPMINGGGAVIGFAVACFDMNWIQEAQQRAGESLAGVRPVDIFLLGGDGKLLNQMLEGDQPPEIDISDRINVTLTSVPPGIALGSFATDNYLVGFAKSKGYGDFKGTDWTVVVREAQQSAYVPAYRTGAAIALSCLVLSLGLSFSAAFGTRYILRGLTKIAASADALKTGQATEFVAIKGADEVARISHSLATLFNNQKLANEQLADLNRNLDRKVVERTREVQRLSEETKNATITRERLRMSRDLHDTLAHSMLAMLTQIRLMRKLYRSKPELLEDELVHAENAAQEGLNLAREAVTGLRYFAIRDDGLDQALRRLIKHLKERVEIEVTLEVDSAAAGLAGPKVETLYRIAEEALRNVEKHAEANHVDIRVTLDQADPANHALKLTIEDDGRGFDSSVKLPGHFGLLGMQEQADIIGGKFELASVVDKGTRIQLEISI